jgi:DNA topoisomerase-6 subunit A
VWRRQPSGPAIRPSLSNVRFNSSKRFHRDGQEQNRRQLFNLSQAKSFMQTMLVASGCKQLIEQDKTTSIRGLYYLLKHTIDGTKEDTFADQGECDPVIEDVRGLLNSLREELHLYAQKKGDGRANITRGPTAATRSTARGWARRLRHSVDRGAGRHPVQEVRRQVHPACRKRYGLATLQRGQVLADPQLHPDPRRRQPPRGVRRLLYRMHNELKLPVYCLLDNDPWGYYIYSVIKQGSINLAFESQRMAIPDAKFLGLRSIDFDRCEPVRQRPRSNLNDTDKKRAKQIAKYPWFAERRPGRRKSSRCSTTASSSKSKP